MRKITIITTLIMLTATLIPMPRSAIAQESSPADVMRTIYEAVAADDIDAAMALIADDVVAVFMPPPADHDGIITGKDEMRAWFEGLKTDFTFAGVDFGDIQINGNKATWKAKWHTDDFLDLGLDAVEFEGSNIVQNGLLKQHTWIFTEDFLAKLAAANALEANRASALRFMQELWDEGNLDVVDEIVAVDFINYSPPPGLGADREGLKEDVASFHANFPDHSARFRIDDLIITEDRAVIRNTTMIESTSDAEMEGDSLIVILSMEDGLITERWLGWITCGGQPVIAVCFGPVIDE